MISQVAIMIFGASAIWFVGRKEEWKKWGYVLGMLGQPFWIYESYTNEQWGILIMILFYAFSWMQGIWNYWIFPNKETGMPKYEGPPPPEKKQGVPHMKNPPPPPPRPLGRELGDPPLHSPCGLEYRPVWCENCEQLGAADMNKICHRCKKPIE